jgi:CRP-like cAMP-binding protein
MDKSLSTVLTTLQPHFSISDLEQGSAYFKKTKHKAKSIFLQEGKVCDQLFVPINSITRCFYHNEEGEEQTLWMKPEKTFISEFKSFTRQEPSQFNLQFYEDTEVLSINRNDLLELYKENNSWALFGITLTENLHVTLIDVFVNLLANDATRNYQYIEYAFPRFIQVAPLKDIASMLQISQVSLSRIRSGNQLKS